MRMRILNGMMSSAIASSLLSLSVAMGGSVTFNSSGLNSTGNSVSGVVTFTGLGNGSVQVTITNTSAPTPVRGDILTGFFFNIVGATPTLTLASGTGTVVQNGQASFTGNLLATVTNGAYQLLQNPTGTLGTNLNNVAFPYMYGVSTVGDTGIFSGSLVGADELSIVAAGTNIAANKLGGLQYVQTTATFVLTPGVPCRTP